MDLSEVRTAVERFVCDLNDIRRRAEEREIAAKRDLDQEAPALQRKISALRKLKTQLKEELNARQRKEYDDARQRLAEIEKAYNASVQHRLMVSALPSTQTWLDFILGGNPTVSDCSLPKPLSSTQPCSGITMEVYHADDLAPVAEAQGPYCPARPVFIPTSSAKRRAEDTPNKSGKRLRRAASAMALAEEAVGNELYDDGNAKCDSRIVQDHKGWFIFKCEEHNLEIPCRAASVASSHLEIHAHDGPSAALSPITQALGVVPIEYDEENAELDDVERAPTTGYEALNSTTKHDALGSMQAVGDCDTSETIDNACPNDSSSPTGVRHASVTASDTTS